MPWFFIILLNIDLDMKHYNSLCQLIIIYIQQFYDLSQIMSLYFVPTCYHLSRIVVSVLSRNIFKPVLKMIF